MCSRSHCFQADHLESSAAMHMRMPGTDWQRLSTRSGTSNPTARGMSKHLDGRQRGGVPLPQRAEGVELQRRAGGLMGQAQPAAGEQLLRQRPGAQLGLDLVRLRIAWDRMTYVCVCAVRLHSSIIYWPSLRDASRLAGKSPHCRWGCATTRHAIRECGRHGHPARARRRLSAPLHATAQVWLCSKHHYAR